jgi:hypothetical protein
MNTCGLSIFSLLFPSSIRQGDQGLRNARQAPERQIHVIKVRVVVAKTTTTATIRERVSVA